MCAEGTFEAITTKRPGWALSAHSKKGTVKCHIGAAACPVSFTQYAIIDTGQHAAPVCNEVPLSRNVCVHFGLNAHLGRFVVMASNASYVAHAPDPLPRVLMRNIR